MKYKIQSIASNHALCCMTPIPPACMSGSSDAAKNKALIAKGCCARCPNDRCNGKQPCSKYENRENNVNEITQHTFDYSTLPAPVAIEARAASERIRMRLRRTAEDIVETGRELAEMKEKLPHGQFLPWIEAEFDMSERTAHNFMAVSKRFKSATVADFSPKVLYLLAAPSTPDSVTEKAVAQAQAGEKVSVEQVKRWKAEAESAKDEVKQLQKALKETKEAALNRIKALEQGAPEPQVITKEIEVVPDDYEPTKEALQSARDELQMVQEEADNVRADMANANEEVVRLREELQEVRQNAANEIRRLQSEQKTKTVEKQVIPADYEETRRELARAKETARIALEQIEAMKSQQVTDDDVFEEWEVMLFGLSRDIQQAEFCRDNRDSLLKLSEHFTQASSAIRASVEHFDAVGSVAEA